MNDRDSAIFSILSGVHQRLQAETRTVEGVLRMLTAQSQESVPQKPALPYLGAEETPQQKAEGQ